MPTFSPNPLSPTSLVTWDGNVFSVVELLLPVVKYFMWLLLHVRYADNLSALLIPATVHIAYTILQYNLQSCNMAMLTSYIVPAALLLGQIGVNGRKQGYW